VEIDPFVNEAIPIPSTEWKPSLIADIEKSPQKRKTFLNVCAAGGGTGDHIPIVLSRYINSGLSICLEIPGKRGEGVFCDGKIYPGLVRFTKLDDAALHPSHREFVSSPGCLLPT